MKIFYFLILSSCVLAYSSAFSSDANPENDHDECAVTYKFPLKIGGEFLLPPFHLSFTSRQLLEMKDDEVVGHLKCQYKKMGEDAFGNELEKIWGDLSQLPSLQSAERKIKVIFEIYQQRCNEEKARNLCHDTYRQNIAAILKEAAENIARKINRESGAVQQVLTNHLSDILQSDEEKVVNALGISSLEGISTGVRTLISTIYPLLSIQHAGLEASASSAPSVVDPFVEKTIENFRNTLRQREEKLTRLKAISIKAENIDTIQ